MASRETAIAYGNGLTDGGVAASEKMASDDLARINNYKPDIKKVARKHNVDPALVAAIISRESQGGKSISGTNGYGDHGNGYGLMQVDKRWHQPKGAWDSEAHLDQATGILADSMKLVKEKRPGWSKEQQMKGAVAYYNMGNRVLDHDNVDQSTTGKDYSSDVMARAQYYKRNGF